MPTNPEPKDGITERTAGAQGVELKVTVSEQRGESRGRRLQAGSRKGERRRIFFFDTNALALFKGGLVLRAQGSEGWPGRLHRQDPSGRSEEGCGQLVPSWRGSRSRPTASATA